MVDEAGVTGTASGRRSRNGLLGQDIAAALRPGDVLALGGRSRRRQDHAGARSDPGLGRPTPGLRSRARPSRWSRATRRRFPSSISTSTGFPRRRNSTTRLRRGGRRRHRDRRMAGASGRRCFPMGRLSWSFRMRARAGMRGSLDHRPRSTASSARLRRGNFFDRAGWARADRAHFSGDASARSYETVARPDAAPLHPDELAAAGSGSAGARRQTLCRDRPHGAVGRRRSSRSTRCSRQGGVAVPEIFAQDLDGGFLLIENLGSGSFLDGRGQARSPSAIEAAAKLLAEIHGRSWPKSFEAAPGMFHRIPPFDRDAMMIEAELLLDWYVPAVFGKPADPGTARRLRGGLECRVRPSGRKGARSCAARLPFAQPHLAR